VRDRPDGKQLTGVTKRVDVSFIIVNWNTRELLLQCIGSIISTKGDYSQEIIVVDNASQDGSSEAVKEKYPEVIIIQNSSNLGFAKANNIGIKKSIGGYVCLLNSDVQVLSNAVSFMIKYMDNNTQVAICGPKILWPDMTTQYSCMKFPSLWTQVCESMALNRLFPRSALFSGEYMTYYSHDRLKKVDWLIGCFMLIRRSALEKDGLLDERYFIYSEETDLCKRFHESGSEIVFLPDVSAIHHNAASSGKNPVRFSVEQVVSAVKYWKKHKSRLSRGAFFILLLFHHAVRYGLWQLINKVRPRNQQKIADSIRKHRECILTVVRDGLEFCKKRQPVNH
jgi:GT2 family glycosyltransferase